MTVTLGEENKKRELLKYTLHIHPPPHTHTQRERIKTLLSFLLTERGSFVLLGTCIRGLLSILGEMHISHLGN